MQSAWLDQCSIGVGSIKVALRSIESIFWPIKNRSKCVFKKLFSCVHHIVYTFSKAFSFFFFDRSTSSQFLSFSSGNFSSICLLVQVRPKYLSFFIKISFFLHLHAFFSKNFWHGIFGIFNFRAVFNHIWPMDFCS